MLAPDSAAWPYAVWLNRATLTNVDLYDQMFDIQMQTIMLLALGGDQAYFLAAIAIGHFAAKRLLDDRAFLRQ